MPKSPRSNHRAWAAAWAVLCVAGLAATAQLNASSAPDPQPKKPVSAECSDYIADIERQVAQAKQAGESDGILAFSRSHAASGDDCDEELRNHFGGDR
ncbi:hypothetical protein GT204_13245 [Streptomyces sp. SID4919]|uniref:hypothetical protein n=1 Tax=unclassified Streptomyces TaxID=2593676 RepID=UPI000823CD1F|nr:MULTISPECIES: hypothetical protein [unclassified Streptomyces]MYY09852.1 hypothetical protein [Streptomyces sp. SID4919]SCK37003.1 hypothetical protein YW7DRAFT_03119 [Streptomyces sp. AmelKG-E11A]